MSGGVLEGIALSMPERVACHGSRSALPSIRGAMHTIYFTVARMSSFSGRR